MLKVIALGLGIGAAIQAWRQFPASGPLTQDSVALLFCVGLLAAYLGGRWHGRHHASAFASAVASAEAESTAVATGGTVNLAVVLPGSGAGQASSVDGVRVPDSSVSWFGTERLEVTADDLEGLDLSELAQDGETVP